MYQALLPTALLIAFLLSPTFGALDIHAQDADGLFFMDSWRESILDRGKLTEVLSAKFSEVSCIVPIETSTWGDALRFRELWGLSDEHLGAALVNVYREAAARKKLLPSDNQDALWKERIQEQRALSWLGVCVDRPSRALLLEVATDKSVESDLRTTALLSYLRAASPNEAKRALIDLLIGEERLGPGDRGRVYGGAGEVYAGANAHKRWAIRSTFQVSAAHEESREGFLNVDGVLAGWSDAYRRSRERLVLMERHGLLDAKGEGGGTAFVVRPTVNTNLAVLKAQNFNCGVNVGYRLDEQSRPFLLDLAADRTLYSLPQSDLLCMYLDGADAEATKDALMRFLIGPGRMKHRYPIYLHATERIYSNANDTKRRAIVATLLVAAAYEDDLGVFVALDGMLAKKSKAYCRSRQRRVLLEWHALRLPHNHPYWNKLLLAARAEARKYWRQTEVNMNLANLMAQDFTQPLTPQQIQQWGGALDTPKPTPPAWVKKLIALRHRRVDRNYVALGLSALALGAVGIWLFRTWRRVLRP